MRSILAVALVVLVSSFAAQAFGAPKGRAPVPQQLSRKNIIPLSEIRPGMEGYGLTVFEGTKVERFHVRVIGILKKMLPRQDVILFRSDDPRLKHSGIVRGMSGSPVYLGGRLAGAVAYGWPYSKDPIGGITPIEAMLETGDWKRRGKEEALQARADTAAGREAFARFFGGEQEPARGGWGGGRPDGAQPLPAASGAREGMRPVAIPLSLAGFHPRAVEELRRGLSPFGLEPMSGAGGGEEGGEPRTFEPGGAIGVALVRGDMSAVGTGTVTHVEGNTVLAFGHPMFGVGEWYLPVMTARIHTVLPSVAASFKMSSPVAEAGALVMDRQAAIVADTAMRVPMIPIEVTVKIAGGTPRVFRAEVARHRLLTPMLAGTVVMSGVFEAAPDLAPAVVRIRSNLKIAGYDPLLFDDKLFSIEGVNPRLLAFSGAFRAMQDILLNPFEKASIERLTFTVEVAYGNDAAEMIGIGVDAIEVDPGQRVALRIALRKYQGEEFERTVEFVVPREFAGQTVMVEVLPGNLVRPPVPMPETLRGIIENYRKIPYPSDSFVVVLRRPAEGLSYKGRLLPELPPSAIDTLRQTMTIRRVDSLVTPHLIVRPAGMVVVGRQSISLKVRELP